MSSRSSEADSDRQALLELLLAEEGIEVAATGIATRDPERPATLSYAQERMWFLQQFEHDTSSLNVRSAVRLRGRVDADALRDSVAALIDRHDVLRTIVRESMGSPLPVVQAVDDVPFRVDDVPPEADAAAEVERILREEGARTFDLASQPPLMVRLVRVSDSESVLSIVVHHIASDGRSMQVLFRDLAAYYTAFTEDRDPALPPLPIDYLDYAAWQREQASDIYDRQLEYWTAQLGGDLGNCELPTDRPRPPVHTVDGAQVARPIDAALIARLRALGERHHATLFMVLLGAFDVLLDRRIGDPDHTVTVGTPVAGRVRPELEEMVGVFLNTLALRTDLGGDPTFTEVLRRVRDTALDAFANQDVPFERLLGELRPPRDLSRTPFFSVLFNMMSVDVAQQGLDRLMGLEYEILQQPDVGSKFDITLYVDDQRGEGVSLLVVYNRNLYDASTIEELVDQYLTVLEQVAAEPDRSVSTYSLVTESARAVLPDLSDPLDATWHGSVPSHLDRHARERPDAVAVSDAATTWTYAELAAAANRLARALQASGVGRGDVVAILGHRCASLVWAMTGALASGAAYTILDPAYPPHRLAEYLRTVRPRAFVTVPEAGAPEPEVEAQLDELDVSARLALPVDAGGAFADLRSDPLGIDIGPDDLACVTMTSGSTGAARAVLGRHGSLTHFLPWQSAEFAVGPDDRFSMLSGLAHDPIQRDVFWAIERGARIVVPDPDQIAEPGWIGAWLRREGVTVAHLTPAMGRLLLETSRDEADARIDPLRLVMFIGEPLPYDVVERLHARAPAATVVNLYGTTETQRASGYHVLTRGARDSERAIVPLGRGIPGTQLVVRTAGGIDAGTGEVGEIWMRSHHLALGYLGLPDETTRRFLPTPGHGEATDRMYRTGDLGRYLPDGSVQFVGRADDQVQIRGFRVELGDVRAAVCAHPAVADAVVVIQDDHAGDPTLVAYVVAAAVALPSTSDLMGFMRQRVPAHMVPSAFVEIAAIPRTPNGKLDRRALPAPTIPDAQVGGAARDSLEHLLVELWQDVLGRRPVGIHDNFFDLGGYSLLATRLFALIEDATGHRVPVATLFQSPTVAELAETIRSTGWETEWSSLVPISPGGSRIPLFYVTPYLISVLQLAHLGEELGEDQPLYGLQPRGLDGSVAPDERIEDMAAHYISEIRSVQPHGPYLVGGHCAGSWVGFEIARQLEAAGEEVAGVLLVDLGPPGIDRPEISTWRYAWHRLKFFKADGRLWPALTWQAKIALNRVLLRRVGRETVRATSAVQAAHYRAHRSYEGGDVRCDLVLIRTDETIALGDRGWFLRWDERTTGDLHVTDPVVGIHSDLLEQPNVKVLAATMRSAMDALPTLRARATRR